MRKIEILICTAVLSLAGSVAGGSHLEDRVFGEPVVITSSRPGDDCVVEVEDSGGKATARWKPSPSNRCYLSDYLRLVQ